MFFFVGRLTLKPIIAAPQSEIYFSLEELQSTCHARSKRGVILVDEKISALHGAFIQNLLGYELIAIPARKTRESKQAVEDELLKRRIGKDAVFVACGGGVITDLVGFIASTYMRGAPLVLIPTTLLAMVDAAVGGKTGVDTSFGKNLIGSFYLPEALFIDAQFLGTLPEIEMKNGLSEILKYGLIQDSQIWEKSAQWKEELSFLIEASVACKVKIVEQDYEEKGGLRRILNFGHTVGHALEFLSNYQMAHGEAVALGCMAESYLSHQLGYLSSKDLESILQVYRSLGYRFKKIEAKNFLEAMTMDKKSKMSEPRFVLIDRIGRCRAFDGEYCRTVPLKEMNALIQWMNHG